MDWTYLILNLKISIWKKDLLKSLHERKLQGKAKNWFNLPYSPQFSPYKCLILFSYLFCFSSEIGKSWSLLPCNSSYQTPRTQMCVKKSHGSKTLAWIARGWGLCWWTFGNWKLLCSLCCHTQTLVIAIPYWKHIQNTEIYTYFIHKLRSIHIVMLRSPQKKNTWAYIISCKSK